ncbi:MAG: sensor histidine kinase [Verrucomicrobiales bacterium]|nr:sensor histidine kinase [Verrucomicrobiales bacterium]
MTVDVPELEIIETKALGTAEGALVDHHSLLNLLHVLDAELQLLGLSLEGQAGALARSLDRTSEFAANLKDRDRTLALAGAVDAGAELILEEVAELLNRYPARRHEPEVADAEASIMGVLDIFRARCREVMSRSVDPGRWDDFEVAVLRQKFLQVFRAMETHGRERFHIAYNLALQGPQDYYVDFKLEGVDGTKVRLPSVFVDVMRDLIANARKYTAPGGLIIANLHQSATEVRFVVLDTGRGIPEAEISRVVEFGYRASNVQDVRTRGGGFGLTKAYLVTRRFGGRFWIASRQGVGTRIRIVIPNPATASH